MTDAYDFDADRMTGETRDVITRAEALKHTVDHAQQSIQAMIDEMHKQQDAAPPSGYVEVFAIPEMMIRRTCDRSSFALMEQSKVVEQLLAEVKRLRSIPAPDGYWWVIREDADGNEVSRELRPLDPPTE